MAQSDPMSGLVNKIATWAEKVDPSKPPAQKPDTSWHDEMTRKATESFTKPQSKASADPKLGRGKKKFVAKKKAPAAKKR